MPANNKNVLYQYVGFATQTLVLLGLGTYGGNWLDLQLQLSFPIFIWLIPVVLLMAIFWQLIRKTKNEK